MMYIYSYVKVNTKSVYKKFAYGIVSTRLKIRGGINELFKRCSDTVA